MHGANSCGGAVQAFLGDESGLRCGNEPGGPVSFSIREQAIFIGFFELKE
jgi:hypothetical protein